MTKEEETVWNPSAHEELLDIEAIEQIKAKYCLYMDTKEWESWRALFTEDLVECSASEQWLEW